MLFSKLKRKIRILPIFIFMATLTLSIRVNSLFDNIKQQTTKTFSISQTNAKAEEKSSKETNQLDQVLEHGQAVASSADQSKAESLETQTNKDFTQSEILILQDLATRREALDLRSKEIDKKAIQLKVAEEEIDKKLKQLQEYEQKLNRLVNEYNEKQKEKISSLVKLYSTMKPKDAARIFNTLDIDIIVSLFKEMKPSVASSILSQMSEQKAKTVTDELIGNNFFKTDEN